MNEGLQIDWVRRQVDPDAPKRAEAPDPVPPKDSVRGTSFSGPQLPVTPTYAGLDSDGTNVALSPFASPTTTLSASEVARSPVARRAELLRRHRDYIAHLSGASVVDGAPKNLSASRGGFTLRADDGVVTATSKDGRTVTVDFRDPTHARVDGGLELLLETFEAVLIGRGIFRSRPSPPAGARELFQYLLKPGGVLNPQSVPSTTPSQRFSSPKLICWDFNGTVERARNAGFRPDIGVVTEHLNAMGASSVLTTSIDPRAVEEVMVQANLHFNAYFGGPEVRPDSGKKIYAGVARAYGLDAKSARHEMVTIGDSATDMSADLEGVVFINSDSDTPAEVIQLFLHGLDTAGGGSFSRGLEALVSRTVDERPQTCRLGELVFDVAMPADAICPKITGLRLARGASGVVRGLGALPSNDVDSRARYQLNFRHVENQLPEEELVEVVEGVDTVADPGALLDALLVRSDGRQEEVRVARLAAATIDAWLDRDPSASDVKQLLSMIVRTGDSESANRIEKWSATYQHRTAERADAAHRELASGMQTAYGALHTAAASSRRTKLSRTADDRQIASLEKALGRLPGDTAPLIKALTALAEKGTSSRVRRALDQIDEAWPKLVHGSQLALKEHFDARTALDVTELVRPASSIADVREAIWRDVDQAIAAKMDSLGRDTSPIALATSR